MAFCFYTTMEFDIKFLPKNMKKCFFFVPITLLTELVFPLSLFSSPSRPTPNHQIELGETLLVICGNDYFRKWQHLWCCWHSSMPLHKYGLKAVKDCDFTILVGSLLQTLMQGTLTDLLFISVLHWDITRLNICPLVPSSKDLWKSPAKSYPSESVQRKLSFSI